MRPRTSILVLAVGLLVTLASFGSAEAGITRYVSNTDPTCGGLSPCYSTIQSAVNAAQAGDTVRIQAGTYHEIISTNGKNSGATSEASRIIIEGDPAAG